MFAHAFTDYASIQTLLVTRKDFGTPARTRREMHHLYGSVKEVLFKDGKLQELLEKAELASYVDVVLGQDFLQAHRGTHLHWNMCIIFWSFAMI